MVHFKECRRRFNRIPKGNENEGYTDWKKWIYKEVADYNEEKMENLIKRYEIRLKMVKEDDGFRVFTIMTQVVTVLAVMFPFAANMILTALITNIGAYNFDNDTELMRKFAHIVSDTMQEMGDWLIVVGSKYFIILCIALLVAKLIDAVYFMRKNKSKVYYEELLLVLKQISKK